MQRYETARSCVGAEQSSDQDRMWACWKAFVATLQGIDPCLNSVEPHLHASFLQVFAHKIRHRRSPSGGKPVSSKRVQDCPRAISKEIRLGSRWRTDPRCGDQLTMAIELAALHKACSKADPPPEKVKPVPIDIIRHACDTLPKDFRGLDIANALIFGFFWLLRPGECTYCSKCNHPIRLQDTTLQTRSGFANAVSAPISTINKTHGVVLNFPTQKNKRKNDPVTHGDTSDPVLSPVQAIKRQVLHLRQHNAPPQTPLCSHYHKGTLKQVTARDLTTSPQLSAASSCSAVGAKFGLAPKDISARALRNGGCVALIRAGVDPLQARLMGRWRSWSMLEYLQETSLDTSAFAQRMLDSGSCVIPHHQLRCRTCL